MRYCTFAFNIDQITSNIIIKFHDIRGFGWGGRCCTHDHLPRQEEKSLVAQDMTLQIRLISSDCDTWWLNANSVFDPCQPFQFANGQPCLLAASSASENHVTFDCAKCQGTLYVRIGLDCHSAMHKSFSNISLVCHF